MEMLNELLAGFDSLSLKEMEEVSLQDRVDRKFTFHLKHLPNILETLRSDYRVLEHQQVRISRYETLYYDTESLMLFRHHHNGILNRFKVRFRCYKDSDIAFFEVKFRNNRDRTIKKRIKRDGIEQQFSAESAEFLEKRTNLTADQLSPRLWVHYSRITLVNKTARERLTIDVDLNYSTDGRKAAYPSLVIAEVKQERTGKSPFISLMKQSHIHSRSVSKYCLGIISLIDNVKMNNFKQKFQSIKRICND